MCKIFNLVGNFSLFGNAYGSNGEKDDRGFAGQILLDNDGTFIGYSTEKYPCADYARERYVIGAFCQNNLDGRMGMGFYRLSNEFETQPILTIVPSIDDGVGEWSVPGMLGSFEPQGNAKVRIKETVYYSALAQTIGNRFGELDFMENSRNLSYCNSVDSVKRMLTTLS